MLDEAALLRSHDEMILRLAKKFKNIGLPLEDLQQEARIAFLSGIRAWSADGGASVSTLGCKFAHTALCRLFRDVKREKRKAQRDAVSLDEPIDDDRSLYDLLGIPPSQEDAYNEAERRDLVLRLAKNLPKNQRLCIEQSLQGRTGSEIGRLRNVTRKAIGWDMKDAVDTLRRQVQSEGLAACACG